MMKRTVIVLACLAGLGACSGESEAPERDESAASPVAIADGCEIVESHWGRASGGDDAAAMRSLYDDLSAITDKMNSADAATLRPFAIAALNVAEAPEGAPYADAYASYLETFKDAADACEAAGSPVV